jgi:hypothetical protein
MNAHTQQHTPCVTGTFTRHHMLVTQLPRVAIPIPSLLGCAYQRA